MKFLTGSQSSLDSPLVFEMTRREKALLLGTLRLFPALENRHHRLSNDPKAAGPAEQRLLEESMAQQRMAFHGRLDELFSHPERFFSEVQDEVRLTLTGEQLEWLLRVLNDIRVGSWVQLGRPELEAARRLELPRDKSRAFAAMEMSGYFQFSLLQAFS